jgi:putative effector of murein hydrolase
MSNGIFQNILYFPAQFFLPLKKIFYENFYISTNIINFLLTPDLVSIKSLT